MWKIYKEVTEEGDIVNVPYYVVRGNYACWYSIGDMELDLHYVWKKDKYPKDMHTEYPIELLGEYEDLNTLKMIHLMEK
ncbi:hypothetical protein HYP06_gp082 [Vibrio phage vB_VspP_pVa5]|uniref:Uncharacterized protein n=1 Tax=Vibrio phage vB_VspP_pVa5 TaxID=1913109 RepID=A0A1J0GV81_9CAUD|nr:hypothetical protein HYP06_gp082 [Vibrio phage vB_VspP_pVa5]APC46097.1 hypothetical protein vBVspPpVa5_0091 [Vibrio phage vB_VspP_pVa5]